MKGTNWQEFTRSYIEQLSLFLLICKIIILQWQKLSHTSDLKKKSFFFYFIFTAHSRLEASASCEGKNTGQVWLLPEASAPGWSWESDGITTPFHPCKGCGAQGQK